MKKAIIIFTKIPIEGKSKTRLMPYYNEQECVELHSCFLHDYDSLLYGVNIYEKKFDVFVYYHNGKRQDDKCEHICEEANAELSILKKSFIKTRVKEYIEQVGEGIGDKMFNALNEVLSRGYRDVVLVGTDIPSMTKDDIFDAYEALEKHDIVLGPTYDGGFYLVGMKNKNIPSSQLLLEKADSFDEICTVSDDESYVAYDIFEIDNYETSTVIKSLVSNIENLGLSYEFVSEKFDIDVKKDIKRLYLYYDVHKEYTYTATYKYLQKHKKISVIIPVYNEGESIKSLAEEFDKLSACGEIIIVDGGSTDGSYEKLEKEINKFSNRDKISLIRSEKGRAVQMNAGVKESSGNILFFLHADSKVSENFEKQIFEVMKDNYAGCFKIRFDRRGILMLSNRIQSNKRVQKQHIVFGDQGLFIDREIFYKLGKFPELPIMEDYEFSKKMKAFNIRPVMADGEIITSARRYPKSFIGTLKIMRNMKELRKQYDMGVDVYEISAKYEDVR